MVGIFLHGAPHATDVVRNHASDRASAGANGIRSPGGRAASSSELMWPRIIPGRARTRRPSSSTLPPYQ